MTQVPATARPAGALPDALGPPREKPRATGGPLHRLRGAVDVLYREMIKFGAVGALAYVVDLAVFNLLRTGLWAFEPGPLANKPLTAKVIAVVVATIVSYVLNREWSFRTRGGRDRHQEATLFFVISAIGVAVYTAPLAISRYVLGLQVPEVSLLTQEVADFVAAQIIGVLLGMAFRWWAFRRYVFPLQNVRRQATNV